MNRLLAFAFDFSKRACCVLQDWHEVARSDSHRYLALVHFIKAGKRFNLINLLSH